MASKVGSNFLSAPISFENKELWEEINNGTKKISPELDLFIKTIVYDPKKMETLPKPYQKQLNWRYDRPHIINSKHEGFRLGSNPIVTKNGVSFMIQSGKGTSDFCHISTVEGEEQINFKTPDFGPIPKDMGDVRGNYFCPATSNGKYTATAQYSDIYLFSSDKFIKKFSFHGVNNQLTDYMVLELKIIDQYLFAKVFDRTGLAWTDEEICLVVYDINSLELINAIPLKFSNPPNLIGEEGCTDFFDLHPKICFGKEYIVDLTVDGEEEDREYSLAAYPWTTLFDKSDKQIFYTSQQLFSHPSIFAEDNHFIVISRGKGLEKIKIDKVEIIEGEFIITNLANIWEGDEYRYEAIDYKNKKVACVYRSMTDLKTCRIATYDFKTNVECRFPKLPFSNLNMFKQMNKNFLFQPKIIMEEAEPKIHYFQMIKNGSNKIVLDHFCLDYTNGKLSDQEDSFVNSVDIKYEDDAVYLDLEYQHDGSAYSFIHDYKGKLNHQEDSSVNDVDMTVPK